MHSNTQPTACPTPWRRSASRRVLSGSRQTHGRSHRMLGALAVAALGASGLAVGFGVIGLSSDAASPPPLGIYLGYENTSGVTSFGNTMGQQPAFAMDYLDGSSWSTMESSAANEAAKWSPTGYAMTFSIPMLPNSGATLADGAAGDYNAYFETMAQGLVANNEAGSIVRVGWEFNGNWYPWAANSSNASQFIAYWQQIVTAMRSVSGAGFKFEWCPTLGDQGIGNLAGYYPGSAYVDDVAADVYDQAWSNYPGAAGEFSDLETESYGLNWLTSFATQQGKPVDLGEWGLGTGSGDAGQAYSANNQQVSGGDDPTFINDMAQWLMTNHIYEASYFDDQSMALSPSQNPNSYNAFLKAFGPGGVASGSSGSAPESTPPPPPPSTTTTTTTTTTAPPPRPTTTTAPPVPTTTTTAPPPRPTTTTSTPPSTTTTWTTQPPAPPRPTTTTTTTPGTSTTPPQTTTTTTAPPPLGTAAVGGEQLTVTALDQSESSVTLGKESTMVFKVTVTPAVDATVGVYGQGGAVKLCAVTVTTTKGSGTCALSDSELGPGLYVAAAVTQSGPGFVGSFSNFATFAVTAPK